jgi:hypothetical protein
MRRTDSKTARKKELRISSNTKGNNCAAPFGSPCRMAFRIRVTSVSVAKAKHAGELGGHEVRDKRIFERTLGQAADALLHEMATVKSWQRRLTVVLTGSARVTRISE